MGSLVRSLLICAVVVCSSIAASAQQVKTATLKILVSSAASPVAKATVSAGGQRASTSSTGEATLSLPVGSVDVNVECAGFLPQKIQLTIQPDVQNSIAVVLDVQPVTKEEVTVTATRSNTRVQDEPLRVEVLGREEVEEKLLMTPGDIAMLLNETAGLRVQVTSPSLGAASLRVQGLRGRYTQLLADGLPLYGGHSGSIGLLQIPPMDLGQVEIIKGVASSLFGASALGGVVNLVSRQPGAAAEHELLLNQTTQRGTDGMLWLSGPINSRWGYTLLGGVDHQARHDIDGDGWADLPEVRRVIARPRLSWNNGAGRSLFVTAGLMDEDREGGTLPGHTVPDGTAFRESLNTRREDAGAVAHLLVGKTVVGIRGSFMTQQHQHGFGPVIEDDTHRTGFGELSLTGTRAAHTWVIGGSVQGDAYRNATVPAFDYTHTTPSVFAQDEFAAGAHVRVSGSVRLDHHNVFGTFVSPRGSILWRLGGWTARGSAGAGYFAPTPLTDETEAVGLTRLASADLSRAERARSASADLGRTFGPVELSVTAFGSRVTDPLAMRPSATPDRYDLARLSGPTRTHGAEALATIRHSEFTIVGTYTFVRSTEPDSVTAVRLPVALTPAHTSGLVVMWERENVGRVGIETYYTGRQRLNDDPYRTTSEPYVYFGVMAERRFGRLRAFVNVENLSDRRQTRFDPLVRPTRRYDGRWTVDAWAPLEGRVLNAGFRIGF